MYDNGTHSFYEEKLDYVSMKVATLDTKKPLFKLKNLKAAASKKLFAIRYLKGINYEFWRFLN